MVPPVRGVTVRGQQGGQRRRTDLNAVTCRGPRRDGCTKLSLAPLELIDSLAARIPPPRIPRYHGVLPPNSQLRGRRPWARSPQRLRGNGRGQSAVRRRGIQSALRGMRPVDLAARAPVRVPAAHLPHCGAHRGMLACITETASMERMLNPIGEPAQTPPIARARGPWDDGIAHALLDWNALAPPESDTPSTRRCSGNPTPPGGAQAPARPSILPTKVRFPLHRLHPPRTPLIACSLGGSVSPNAPGGRLDFPSRQTRR